MFFLSSFQNKSGYFCPTQWKGKTKMLFYKELISITDGLDSLPCLEICHEKKKNRMLRILIEGTHVDIINCAAIHLVPFFS
jgi:hypothetical protein